MPSEKELLVYLVLSCICCITFLLPFTAAIVGDIIFLLLVFLGYQVSEHWEVAEPNQWMILISNGEQLKAGIGLRCLRLPFQQVVKFPSQIQQVSFTANNISLEKQGLEIKGFTIWSVKRDGPGPFQFYKYSQGADANSNVMTTCESIARTEIANHKITDIMQNRIKVRDRMIIDLQKQVSGWGIYIESVEITEVKICSSAVFSNLQAEFRQNTHRAAEKIRQRIDQQLTEIKLNNELELSQKRSENEIEKDKYITRINVQKELENADFVKKSMELDEQKKDLQHKVNVLKQECDFAVSQLRQKNQLTLQGRNTEFNLEIQKKWLELDKNHDKKSIQKYYLDEILATYDKIPLSDISINQYMQRGEHNQVFSILPGISEIYHENQSLLKKEN